MLEHTVSPTSVIITYRSSIFTGFLYEPQITLHLAGLGGLSLNVPECMGDSDIRDTLWFLWPRLSAPLDLWRGHSHMRKSFMNPSKMLFSSAFKWLDRKPSNRGINSQYWPVFPPAAWPHGICSRLWRKAPSPKPLFGWRGQTEPRSFFFFFPPTIVQKCWISYIVLHWFRPFGWLPRSQHHILSVPGMFRVNRWSRKVGYFWAFHVVASCFCPR